MSGVGSKRSSILGPSDAMKKALAGEITSEEYIEDVKRRTHEFLSFAENRSRKEACEATSEYIRVLRERNAALEVALEDALITFADTKWFEAYGYLKYPEELA